MLISYFSCLSVSRVVFPSWFAPVGQCDVPLVGAVGVFGRLVMGGYW